MIVFPSIPLLAAGLDYVEIITQAGLIEKMVLLILVGASIASWTIIFRKFLHLRRAEKESASFLETFWGSKRLDAIYTVAEQLTHSPVSQVFRTGYIELSKLTAERAESADSMRDKLGGIENVERALHRASTAELTHLESTVSFLGTCAAAAPFVGLFGTVWGIMNAFNDIYAMGNANLATVAKPISHALIATAMGLFAAIPAVVAFNSFNSKIRVQESEMSNFSSDFLNIVKRHFFK
jgi:biopolymer transport protein TolQ